MYLRENAKIFQHLYTTLYPKFYSRNNKFGAENRLLFDLCYREWINSKTTNTQLHLLLCQHALDAADKNVFANPYPLPVTFKDVKKFDAQNPVLVNLLTQIEGNKLSDEEIKNS